MIDPGVISDSKYCGIKKTEYTIDNWPTKQFGSRFFKNNAFNAINVAVARKGWMSANRTNRQIFMNASSQENAYMGSREPLFRN